MNLFIEFLSEAEEEFQQAYQWYKNHNRELGEKFIEVVEHSLNSLLQFPQRYPIIHKNIRRIVLQKFPYSILYIIKDDKIMIVACFHGKRNPKYWQERILH